MVFNHLLLPLVVAFFLLTIASGIDAISNRKLNMLFVIVDDLPTTVEPYLHSSHPLKQGNIKFTPNIQALARESVAFHRAYVQYPACNPSRASMLTSRSPIDLQLFNKSPLQNRRRSPLSLPKFFRKTHWVVGTGKVFHNEWPSQFDRYLTIASGNSACGPGKDSCILSEPSLVDNQVTSNALRMISEAPKNRPWLAIVGFHRPHWMYSTTQRSYDSIAGIEDDVQAQTRQAEAKGSLDSPSYAKNGIPPFASAVMSPASKGVTVSKAAEHRKWVYAATQWMDECFGRLMAGIASQLDNTIVILTSDNGVMMFDRAQSGKSVLFNSAKRVPLFIRHPDLVEAKGKRSGAMVELMDIFPTLAAMQGLPIPSWAQGSSLMPVLRQMNSARANYAASTRLGSVTIETRCTTADPETLAKTPANATFVGSWVACFQLSNSAANRVELFGLSIQTSEYNYIEWRVANWSADKTRLPRWDTAGLWGRELYDFTGDDGLTRVNGVEFEERNLAPCPNDCFPRSLSYPIASSPERNLWSLKNDEEGVNYSPPDLQAVGTRYRDVVHRLSIALRAIVRDRDPICSGHGTINPSTKKCDQCIPGWSGEQCEIPRYTEYAVKVFPAEIAAVDENTI